MGRTRSSRRWSSSLIVLREPARHPRVRHRVRDPDLRLHGRDHAMIVVGVCPAASAAPTCGGQRAATPSSPSCTTWPRAGILFLILRAFASGCTALTGVEAISNGVPAFRKPKTQERRDHAGADGRHRGDDVRRRHLPGDPARRARSPRTTRTSIGFHGDHRRPTVIAQIGASGLRRADQPRRFYFVQLVTGAHPDPGRQHRVQRLPGAGLDPGARPATCRGSCTPAATGSCSATASSCWRCSPAS